MKKIKNIIPLSLLLIFMAVVLLLITYAIIQPIFNDPYLHTKNSWGQGEDVSDMWGIYKIKCPEAWTLSQYKGDGVIVAIIGSGIDYNHPDLLYNIWTNPNEIPENGIDDDNNGYIDDYYGCECKGKQLIGILSETSPSPVAVDITDIIGLGTACAGIIAAEADNGEGIVGVAPQARIMAIKIADPPHHKLNYDGYGDRIKEAMVYAGVHGARVVVIPYEKRFKISWNDLNDLAKIAYDYNMLLIVPAGVKEPGLDILEEGYKLDEITEEADPDTSVINNLYLANISGQYSKPNVIRVAASTQEDKRWTKSNYGSVIDVCAPGSDNGEITLVNDKTYNILTTKAEGVTYSEFGRPLILMGEEYPDEYYMRFGSTLAPCCYVAGLAALISAEHPEYTPAEVKQIIVKTADNIGEKKPDIYTGYGRINAERALGINHIDELEAS